jgi:hypothetical protein
VKCSHFSFCQFFRGLKVAAEGFEPPCILLAENDSTGKVAHQVAHLNPDSDSAASLKQQALDDLQRAWKSIRRMESLSDDPAESKVAGRALAFVDRAFEELEGGKR